MPKKVDANLLQDYGVSKGNVFALLSALRFFRVIDNEGSPSPTFSLLQTTGDEFQHNLEHIVREAYPDLFSRFDLARDSEEQIRNYFARNYSASQAGKATALFYALCSEAGIPTAEGKRLKIPRAESVPGKPKVKIDVSEKGKQAEAELTEEESKALGQPRIDIRIHSKDFSSMQPNQIQVFFNGLSKVIGREKPEE
jgi:hypothetical protein